MKSTKRSYQIRQYFLRYANDVEESLSFLEWFTEKAPKLGKPKIQWEGEAFRIVYGNYNPLSVAGSLAKGGRFNIGGAQLNQFFPNLSMHASLYAASTLKCARKEAGGLIGMPQEYILTPKKPLALWDLEELLVKVLDYPNLKPLVDSTPLAAIWALQKVPRVSQIMGNFLKKAGGNGLIYPSTKDRKGKIFAFFIKDDQEAARIFNYSEIRR